MYLSDLYPSFNKMLHAHPNETISGASLQFVQECCLAISVHPLNYTNWHPFSRFRAKELGTHIISFDV